MELNESNPYCSMWTRLILMPRKLLYVLTASLLMWFPIDFIGHEILRLFPETIYYDFAKTLIGMIVLAGVLGLFLYLERDSLLELAIATAAVMDTVFGVFYYFLYYYYPSTLPANSPANVLVTNLVGLRYPPIPLTMTIIWQFAVIHLVSNFFGVVMAALIFLRAEGELGKISAE